MNGRTPSVLLAAVAAVPFFVLPGRLGAQGAPSFSGHYPIGVEGIKAGSVPPPGTYVRDYTVLYFSDDLPKGPPNFDLLACVNAFRGIWITPLKVFGADYGLDFILPFGYTEVTAGPFDGASFSLGDLAFEPLVLSWHFPRADLAAGYALWIPGGSSSSRHPTKLGKGFWSNMFTAGATWYADEGRTWAASALARYELHTEHRDLGVTPGDTLSLEWGLSKTVCKRFDLGVVGYWQQQTTRDRGSGASAVRDSVAGVGFEAAAAFPEKGIFTSFRYVCEVASRDRPQGHSIVLTLTLAF
ncbi:MAG: SphA family protein [Planctomycetota bacterium]